MTADATPVRLELGSPEASTVRGWVESLGWQVTEPGGGDLLPPLLTLTDPIASTPPDGLPSVLLVRSGDDPVRAAARAGSLRPRAVVRWPDERDRLVEVVRAVTAAPSGAHGASGVRVGGAAGGVGTTTVTLALGGLAAWGGARTLVLGRGDVPVPEVRRAEADAVAGPGGWRAGTAVPGVPGLRAVALTDRVEHPPQVDGVDLVLADVGVDLAADVLVLRRDAAGLAALGVTEAGVAVVVDEGPAHPREVARVAAGRRVVSVARSARVARASLVRRVPAGLPGAWLRSLAPVLRGVSA